MVNRRLSEFGLSSIRRREIQQGVMFGACALAAVVMVANLYTWGRVLAALVLSPRARLSRALRRDAPTLALRPEVQTLTHTVSVHLSTEGLVPVLLTDSHSLANAYLNVEKTNSRSNARANTHQSCHAVG